MRFSKQQSGINQSSTFAKFYLRDMSQQLENLHNLGPIVVAQKVVVVVGEGVQGNSAFDA